MVGPGRIAKPANIIGQDTGNEPRGRIGQKAHGITNPIITGKGFGRSPILIDQNTNGILMLEVYRLAIRHAVGVDGIWG